MRGWFLMALFDFFKKKNIIITKEMEDNKAKLEDIRESVKTSEKDLVFKKLEEKKAEYEYQNSCPHSSMHYAKKEYETENFSDYLAKCDICEAEIFSKQRAIMYLSSLNSLLLRMPKIVEMLKVADLEMPKDVKIIDKSFSLLEDLAIIRNMVNNIKVDEYNSNVKIKCKKDIEEAMKREEQSCV